MSYRVNYAEGKRFCSSKGSFLRKMALSGLFFLLFVLWVYSQWPQGMQLLRRVLITDDAALAIECFMLDLEMTGSWEAAFRNLLSGF